MSDCLVSMPPLKNYIGFGRTLFFSMAGVVIITYPIGSRCSRHLRRLTVCHILIINVQICIKAVVFFFSFFFFFWKLELCFQTDCLRSVLCTLLSQEEIDIFEGVKDAQALRLAENLGFRGALQQQVIFFFLPRNKTKTVFTCKGLVLFNTSLVLWVFFSIYVLWKVCMV